MKRWQKSRISKIIGAKSKTSKLGRKVASQVSKLKEPKFGQKIADWKDNQKVALTSKLLDKDGTILHDLYRNKSTPEQLYKALGLEAAARHAYNTGR
ncbi:hypothetical protein ON010_g9536 [Phytophthora cinnamomi]|nr:hypothetical protein ON010_g9536 [Phytophthora cinnamomi]